MAQAAYMQFCGESRQCTVPSQRFNRNCAPDRFPRDRFALPCQACRVTSAEAIALLEKLQAGRITSEEALRAFQAAPVADLGFAQVDTHRSLRKGFPEVIYGEGKTPEQVARIALKIAEREQRFLVTRVGIEHVRALRRRLKRVV